MFVFLFFFTVFIFLLQAYNDITQYYECIKAYNVKLYCVTSLLILQGRTFTSNKEEHVFVVSVSQLYNHLLICLLLHCSSCLTLHQKCFPSGFYSAGCRRHLLSVSGMAGFYPWVTAINPQDLLSELFRFSCTCFMCLLYKRFCFKIHWIHISRHTASLPSSHSLNQNGHYIKTVILTIDA